MSSWVRKITKDRILYIVLVTVFGVLSIASIVSARSAQTAAEKSQVIIERSNRNSPILDIIKDCTTPGGQCYQRNAQSTGKVVNLVSGQSACLIEEFTKYQDLIDPELSEIKADCAKLLGGTPLDLIRRAASG